MEEKEKRAVQSHQRLEEEERQENVLRINKRCGC